MIETKQEAMESAYKECLKSCPGPLKCKNKGLIFAVDCYFFCPDFKIHEQMYQMGIHSRLMEKNFFLVMLESAWRLGPTQLIQAPCLTEPFPGLTIPTDEWQRT